MATTFDRTDPLGGLPPKHILEDGGYSPVFTDKLKLEEALGFCKTTLENNLKANINLVRVSAPLFVTRASGFNDNLNVSFSCSAIEILPHAKSQVVKDSMLFMFSNRMI